MTAKNIPFVVVDEGSSQVKVRYTDQKTGEQKSLIIPSNVTDENVGTDNDGHLLDSNYIVDGTTYFVYGDDRKESRMVTSNKRYQISDINRILVHEALRQAGFGGRDVRIVCTLPVLQYFDKTGMQQKERIAAKKKSLTSTNIRNKKDGVKLANITECLVTAESIPAWFDILLDDDLKADKTMKEAEAVMIVDVGGTTTDITLINGKGSPIRRDTVDRGVFHIAENVRAAMATKMEVASVSDNQMDLLLRSKKFAGEDITKLINSAIRPIQSKVLAAMLEFEDNPDSLNYVLYAGGGAALFGRSLAEQYADGGDTSNVIIPVNPEFSVANGLMKNLLLKNKLEAKQSAETA